MHKKHLNTSTPYSLLADGLKGTFYGACRTIKKHPFLTLAAVVALGAFVGSGYYYSQDMELRCVKDVTDQDVAYCAKMPKGLTPEQRQNIPFIESMAEKQYYPAPNAQTRSYADLQKSGGEEFTHLEWTNCFAYAPFSRESLA